MSERMTEERLLEFSYGPMLGLRKEEAEALLRETERARTSEATLTAQLRVAREALEAYLKEPSLKRTLQHGRASQGLVDAERKARATLAAIEEATRAP